MNYEKEYKQTLEQYEQEQKEYIKRCRTFLKAFGNVPEPTEEEREETYVRVKNMLKMRRSSEEMNLLCVLDYALTKLEELNHG